MPNERPGGDVEPRRQFADVATLDDDLGCSGQYVAEHRRLDVPKSLVREVRPLYVPTGRAAQECAELRGGGGDDDARARTSRREQGAGALGRLAADREERQIGVLVRALLDQWRRRQAASIEYGKHHRVVVAGAKARQHGDARWLVHDLQRLRRCVGEERRFRHRIEQGAEHVNLVLEDGGVCH